MRRLDTLPLRFCGVSGSRRQHGNTHFLLTKARDALLGYLDWFNGAQGGVRVDASFDLLETGFNDAAEVRAAMGRADGLVLASPVYFGSISPSLNAAMRALSSSAWLAEKVGTCVAVGTQRNGGQETAIEDMWRWFRAVGASFVGNGPVTSQYGGTAWGGAIGSAEKDEYGVHTTEGAGKRLAQDVLLRALGKRLAEKGGRVPVRLLFFYSGRRPDFFFPVPEGGGPELDFLSLEGDMADVEDCVACAVCPPGNVKEPGRYGCIYDDDVNRAYPRFYAASAIVCAASDHQGLCPPDYWKVLNRMRSVRRNDYDLTGRCGAVYGDSAIPLKWLIRNNLPIIPARPDLLYRETLYREAGLQHLRSIGVDPWTEPTNHE